MANVQSPHPAHEAFLRREAEFKRAAAGEKVRELARSMATLTVAKILLMSAFAWLLISDNVYSTGFEAFMPLFWPIALLYMASGTVGFLVGYAGIYFLGFRRGAKY